VKPGTFHNDLLQLSREQFLETVSEGLPLIYENATALWNEAHEIAVLGNRRAVGILQLFAEEEAAKSLLLFDAIRCPRACEDEFRRQVRGFGNHLAKGIYVKYYGSRPADLLEVRTIVNLERREVYREGDYGEFIAPNSILYMREKRLYASYVREDDNRHGWHQPYPPDLLFGDIVPSAIIRMMKALQVLGLFSKAGLKSAHEHWDGIKFEDPVVGPARN
jgi:hypothetical protein